jgi:hypothetical protein
MTEAKRSSRKNLDYRVWRGYYPGSGFAFAETVRGWTYEIDESVLFGQRIPAPLPKLKITKLSPGELPDTLVMAGSGTFVSPGLHTVIERAVGEYVQFIPAATAGSPRAPYRLLNSLALVPCLDLTRSKYETFDTPPRAIRTFSKMVLTTIAPGGPPIFHVGEMPGVIIVRSDLREAMEATSASAGEFVPIARFRRG